MKSLIILISVTFITVLIYPQDVKYLRGKVVYISENNVETAQSGITVLIEETGDRDKTDNNGIFKIFLNQMFEPGDNVTLTIEKEGWAIRDPLFGKTYVPSGLQKEIIKLSVLPKGSPLFFTDQQIIRYIEYLILKQATQIEIARIDYSKLSLESLLDTMANSWGFTASEIKLSVQNWIEKTLYDTSKYYERGLAEYASNNFNLAGDLFRQSANLRIEHFRIVDEDFTKLSQERQELIKETIRDLRLAGESYFKAGYFDSALIAYKNSIEFLTYSEDWKPLASSINKVAICYYYLTFKSCDQNIFRFLDSASVYFRKGLGLSQTKSLEEWRWKFEGNLIMIITEREIYSDSNNKTSELSNSVRRLEFVEDNRINDNDSKDRYLSRNNIGICYDYLYQHTDSLNKARLYLDSAMLSYISILRDSSFKMNYPLEWTYVINNSTLTSIEIKYNKYSIPSYFEMLVLLISRPSDVSLRDSLTSKIDSTYFKELNDIYLKFLDVEKILKDEKKSLELASVLNSIARLRIQLMMYSNNYLNYNFIQTTDSVISIADSLAKKDGFFSEIMFAIGNKACLNMIKMLYNKTVSIDEIINSNSMIENLLLKGQMLKLYETYLKRIMMLNYFLLSHQIDDSSQKNIYQCKASQLSNDILEKYKELSYYREYEEAVRIQEIINRSN